MKKIILFSLFISSVAVGACFLHFEKQATPPLATFVGNHFPDRYFYPVTLSYDAAEIPCLEASIEGIHFIANLDLGFDGVLTLPSEILNRLINKSKRKPHIDYGIRGKQYRIKNYGVSPLHFGGVVIGGIEAEETNLDFEKDLVIWGDSNLEKTPPLPRIGWRAFPKINLFLELSQPRMVCCDGLDTLKENGYIVDGAIVTDLLMDRGVLEFYVDTPLGHLRCLFDTGTTINILHKQPDPFLEEPTFFHIDFKKELPPMDVSIQGQVVGPIYFYEAELPCGIEAIVGIDFLNEHCVFLDFVNKKIYFLPPQVHIPPENECNAKKGN